MTVPETNQIGWRRSPRRKLPHRPVSDIAGRMLAALAEHRLMTADQLCILCGWREDAGRYATRQWISDQLHALAELGYARWVRRLGGLEKVWFVTAAGAEAAERDAGAADRRIVVLRESQVRARTQAHTLAVNAVGVAFTRWGRERGDTCAWTNEVAHKVMDSAGPSKGLLNADAYLRYDRRLGAGAWAFHKLFVELDRGHMTAQQLGEKLRRYVLFHGFTPRGAEARSWEAFYGQFPVVLYVFATARRRASGESEEAFAARTRPELEDRVDSLSAVCDADPMLRRALGIDGEQAAIQVRCCLLEDLERLGPYAPIFVDPATGGRADLLGVAGAAAGADEVEDLEGGEEAARHLAVVAAAAGRAAPAGLAVPARRAVPSAPAVGRW